MQDKIILGRFPSVLGIYATGSGEYIREQLTHLQDLYDYVEFDEQESIRQDQEHA